MTSPNRVRAFILSGQFGIAMPTLTKLLMGMDNVHVSTHTWDDYSNIITQFRWERHDHPTGRVAFIGYSLGANSIIDIMKDVNIQKEALDLVIGYDPSRQSPKVNSRRNMSVPPNIMRAICYHNTGAWYYGGASYEPPPNTSRTWTAVLNIEFSDWHLNVPNRADLHKRTFSEVLHLQQPQDVS